MAPVGLRDNKKKGGGIKKLKQKEKKKTREDLKLMEGSQRG